MWELLSTTLERYGVGTAVMLAVIISAGVAMRELWKKNQELGVEYRETIKSESDKRQVLREAYEKQIGELRAEMERRQIDFNRRLDEVQEKRLDHERARTREVMELAASVRTASERQADALAFLRDTIARREGV